MPTMPLDAVVVGGGIGGAVLANLLTRGGKRVVVLERNPPPQVSTRPEVLWPHTVEFLRTLLPAESEASWLLPLEGMRMTQGSKQIAAVSREAVRKLGVQPYSTAGHATRRL